MYDPAPLPRLLPPPCAEPAQTTRCPDREFRTGSYARQQLCRLPPIRYSIWTKPAASVHPSAGTHLAPADGLELRCLAEAAHQPPVSTAGLSLERTCPFLEMRRFVQRITTGFDPAGRPFHHLPERDAGIAKQTMGMRGIVKERRRLLRSGKLRNCSKQFAKTLRHPPN